MITTTQLIAGMHFGRMSLILTEFGDGMRGVALIRAGSNMPIERIALPAWHVEQDDGLQFANRAAEGWYYNIFGAGELSNQAREELVAHCRQHEDAILAWCNGDETAVLPAPTFETETV